MALSAYEGYWGAAGDVRTVVFKTLPHPAARLRALQAGDIDGYDLVTLGHLREPGRAGMQIVQRDPFSVMYLGMNQEVPVLQNIKVRQAIEMALDKDTLIRRFFLDNTTQATQFVPPKLSGFNNNAPALGHNPARPRNCSPRPATRARN